MQAETKSELVKKLQAKIDALQGFGKAPGEPAENCFSPFAAAFPCQVFPKGALHVFSSYEPVAAASTNAFITALTARLMKSGSLCLWVGSEKKIFPPALRQFGLQPDRVVFIHTTKKRETLWIIEEALKCEALTAVIAETKELNFTESRRLQLAIEHSGVSGFIHRYRPFSENAIACTTRWKITPLPGIIDGALPGVGHSCWDVQLYKVRNGKPRSWQIEWSDNQFKQVSTEHLSKVIIPNLQVG